MVLEARVVPKGRGVTGCRCPWCRHQPCIGDARRKETAAFQRSSLRALTAGSLMSALWTPSRGTDRLCGGMVAEPDSHPRGRLYFPLHRRLPARVQGPGGHGSTPVPAPAPSRPESIYSTRAELNRSGVVRTARPPGKPLNQCLGCHDIRNSLKS